MKPIVVIVLLLALAGGLAALLLRDPASAGKEPPAAARSAGATSAVEPHPAATRAGDVDAAAPPLRSPARLIRHGTATPQNLENASIEFPQSADEKTNRLTRRVETALAGDIDALIDLTRMISGCRRLPRSEEQLAERLERMARFSAENPDRPATPPRGGGDVEFRSFEELEADMWARFDDCQQARNVLDESLYEQVARLAESGLPTARYLYAIWPPDQDGLVAVDTLELLEYQSLALEYTWSNLQERDPLGLLAMAQSYGSRRQSLFTPVNPLQGQVFTLAAMKCGIDNDWLEQRSVNFGQGYSRFQSRNTEMPSLDEDAAALAERFCPQKANDD